MEKFKKFIFTLDHITCYISCALIFTNMSIVTYNVVARMLFHRPISGLVDIVSLVSAAAAAMSFGYTEKEHGFIQVDFVKEYFPAAIQHVLHIILGVLGFIVMGFVSVRFWVYGVNCLHLKTATMTMRLVYWPICFLLMFGFIVYTLTSLYYFLEEILSWKEAKE